MSKLLNDTKVRIDNVRASFEHLLKSAPFPGTENYRYSVSAIIDKNDKETIKLIETAIKNADKKGIETIDKYASVKKRFNPMKDGDTEMADDPAYENSMFINAGNKNKPAVLDAMTGLAAEESAIYSGMYGKVIISFFPYYKSSTSCGVSASLLGFQKTADGESLGGARATESDFEDDDDILG